jgi:hypothetical protein
LFASVVETVYDMLADVGSRLGDSEVAGLAEKMAVEMEERWRGFTHNMVVAAGSVIHIKRAGVMEVVGTGKESRR